MPAFGPYLDDPAPARQPWEMDPSPDESPVPDVARGFPDLPGYDQIFAPMTGPNPWDVATPDLAGVAQRASDQIRRPSVDFGEPDIQPWDELPHEEQPAAPAVAAYDDPAEGPQPWDAQPAGTVEPGLAGSETFAPEFDANPEGAAADQAWSDVQTKQAELARLDPVKFAEVQALDALNRRHEEAKRQAEANETDRLAMEQSVNNRAKAKAAADRDMAEVTAKAKAMAESSPFESWWDDRSVLGKFAGVIAAVAGGINNPTGPNSGLDFMVRMAEGAADQKWKKLNARRELAAGAQAAASDAFQEETAIRLASYQQAVRGIETQMALYDPAGQTALKLEEVKRGVVAQMAGVAQEAHDKRVAQGVEALKLEQEQQKIDSADQRWRAELAADREKWMAQERRRNAAARAPKPTSRFGKDAEYTVAGWLKLHPDLKSALAPFADQPDSVLTGGDIDELVSRGGKLAQQGTDTARGTGIGQENAERDAKLTIMDPRRPGVVFGKASDPNRAAAIKESLPSIIEATETIDEMIRTMEAEGGASDFVKNKNWQRLTGDEAYLGNVIRVAKKMGAYDAGVAKLAEDMRGGVNTKSFVRDASHGLRNLRENLVRSSQLELGGAGLPPYQFPDLSAPPKAKKDEHGARLMKRPRFDQRAVAGVPAEIAGDKARDLAYDKAALDILDATASRPNDPEAPAAAAQIAEAAISAPNKVARQASALRLWNLRAAGVAAARDAFDALPASKRAAIVSHLPEKEASEAFWRMFDNEALEEAK